MPAQLFPADYDLSKLPEAEVRVASKEDIDRRRSNLSGVNLDEEAARLLQLQHAYQAAAQVVRMSDELFRTLLDAAR